MSFPLWCTDVSDVPEPGSRPPPSARNWTLRRWTLAADKRSLHLFQKFPPGLWQKRRFSLWPSSPKVWHSCNFLLFAFSGLRYIILNWLPFLCLSSKARFQRLREPFTDPCRSILDEYRRLRTPTGVSRTPPLAKKQPEENWTGHQTSWFWPHRQSLARTWKEFLNVSQLSTPLWPCLEATTSDFNTLWTFSKTAMTVWVSSVVSLVSRMSWREVSPGCPSFISCLAELNASFEKLGTDFGLLRGVSSFQEQFHGNSFFSKTKY